MRRSTRELITSDASLAQAQKTSAALTKLLKGHHSHQASESVRQEHYKGHHIIIKTSYDVTVDGKKFDAALAVSNAGNVEYHGMPNVGFASAVDLMRSVIDQFPQEFRNKKRRKTQVTSEHDHAAHEHAASSPTQKKPRATRKRSGRVRPKTARRD